MSDDAESKRPVVHGLRPPGKAALDRVEKIVASLGGRVLDDPCRADEVPGLGDSAYSCGCGGQTRAAIPYDGPGKYLTMCVECDAMHRMPAFR